MREKFSVLVLVFAMLIASASQAEDAMLEDDLLDYSLEDLLNLDVTVASNIVTERDKQPVSISTITRNQIRISGARTVIEVLNTYVPGFFHVEDQDDNIVGFRGIASDNNSKVMFLLNGHVLNTEWFWGPPDSMLNTISLDYIDHIDVIRGPGSVTLGQGALLGVINIVTDNKQGDENILTGGVGKDGYYSAAVERGVKNDKFSFYIHYGVSAYDGQAIRPEGNATRDWEGVEGTKIFDAGNRLRRADNSMGLATLKYGNWNFNLLRSDLKRDIYNFRRDRSQYQQILTSGSLSYNYPINDKHAIKTKIGYEQDDYILHSNLGFTMGGTRENRKAITVIYTGKFEKWRFAAGAEYKEFLMGRRNRDNNNFIVNRADNALLNQPNVNNEWVFAKDIDVKSFFGEAFYELNEQINLFVAFRNDEHPFWGSNLTPRFGGLYFPNEQWRFRLAYQTGFRGAPGVHYAGGFEGDGLLREDNFALVNSATAGNQPDLVAVEPEEIESIEFETGFRPNENLSFNAVLFQNKTENVIGFGAFGSWIFTPVPDNIGTDTKGDWDGYWYFQNTPGSFTAQGLELEGRYKSEHFEVGGSYAMVSLSDADDEAYGSLYLPSRDVGDHFKAYPENILRAHLLLFPKARVNGALNLLNISDWYTDGPKGDGFTQVNGSVSFSINKAFSATLSIYNLTDETQLYPFTEGPAGSATDQSAGAPALENRTYWLKMRYAF